jgi:hypothetical protein
MTAARTAALVAALRNLAETVEGGKLVPQPGQAQTGAPAPERLEFIVEAKFGGILKISGHMILEGSTLVNSTEALEFLAPVGQGTPTRVEVTNVILTSPSVRDLDVYALFQAVQVAGVEIAKWDIHSDGSVGVTIRCGTSCKIEGLVPKGIHFR